MSSAPDTTTATVRPKVDLGALIIPAVVAAVGVFLVAGILGMRVAGDGGLFGPKAFPWIVAVLCFVVATLMTVEVLRPHPVTVTADPGDEADAILDLAPPEPEASNWRSLLIVAAGCSSSSHCSSRSAGSSPARCSSPSSASASAPAARSGWCSAESG